MKYPLGTTKEEEINEIKKKLLNISKTKKNSNEQERHLVAKLSSHFVYNFFYCFSVCQHIFFCFCNLRQNGHD